MEKINAVVLAGSSDKVFGVSCKALTFIHGRPMVDYVLDALKESRRIGQISIVGPVKQLQNKLENEVDYYFEEKGSLFENLRMGLRPFLQDPHVLLVSSDVPLITGQIVDEFLARCEEHPSDLCYPIVEKRLMEKVFPGAERTYVKLKEGSFTGGNIICLNPRVLDICEDFTKKAIEFRKKPWKTGKLLGIKFLAMLLMGMLTIPKIEERFCEILNVKGVAILSEHPELANDVDKPSDLKMAERYLAERIFSVS